MENRYQHTVNGQSVLQADLNAMGEASALADDRVFAELFRMQPYDGSTVRKGILPYGHAASGNVGLVAPNGASGSVIVNPFRAFIGSRTAVGTDAKKNWRDIRSAIAVGTTTLGQTVSFAANASGNPRWDLIYAAVAVDANAASVTRKVKDPTTKAIAGQSVVTALATTVTLAVQAGTAAASPTWPAVPSDAGGTYYIPITYVRIPNGFSASSIVLDTDLGVVAPTLSLSRGALSIEPADSLYTAGSASLTTARIQTWGSSGTRPGHFMPSTTVGGTSLLVALDLTTGSLSHANLSIVDSRDWRGRVCRWMAVAGTSSMSFAWTATSSLSTPSASILSTLEQDFAAASNDVLMGMGATGLTDGLVAKIDGSKLEHMADGTSVYLYSDLVGLNTGALKVQINGAPNCKLFVWIDFSARIDGYGQ